jgi:hypothetical protein
VFYWHSDKERVFEGAYVDCVKITITDEQQNKVYQGHSQDWLTEDDVNTPIGIWSFPLDWCGFRETINKVNCKDQDCSFYRAICKIKTDDGGYLEPIIIDFEVGEVDMNEITEILIEDDFDHVEVPDGGILDYPSDAHIKFTYHNGGSVPVYDVPVKATGYSLVEETLADYDMESGFSYYYFTDWDQCYLSSDFAWSGSRSLAFNNPDTMHYDTCTGYGFLFGDAIDMECVEDVCLDFYYFGKIGPGASFHFIAGAETGGVTLDMRDDWQGLVDNQKTGVTLDKCDEDCLGEPAKWIGPLQPICSYACIDLDSVWAQMAPYAIGPNGEQTYGLLFGWALGGSAGYWADLPEKGTFYMCGPNTEESDWSGVYIDDVTVTAKTIGEEMWTETMILPGPIDPCETVTDQFDWEDPDFSCYRVVVEVPGCTDPFDCYNDLTYWYKYSDFCVLEAKEKMTKQDDIDYSDCTPETWCISDVVGNDCGNSIDPETGEFMAGEGTGDHYALATNCDTWQVPEGVNDYIALGPVDDECDECAGPIDVSHLYVAGAGSGGPSGPYFDEFTFDALSMVYSSGWVQVDPALASLDIEVYDDPYTEHAEPDELVTSFSVGPALSTTPGEIYAGIYQCYKFDINTPGDIELADVEGGISMTETSASGGLLWGNSFDGDSWAYQYGAGAVLYDFSLELFANGVSEFAQAVVGSSGSWTFANIDGALGYAAYENFIITPALGGGNSIALNCTVQLDEGFEGTYPPSGWTTGYYFWNWGPIWGEPSHSGVHHMYSQSSGDSAITPPLFFGDDPQDQATLKFWYAVESDYYPQNLEVYVDTTDLVWSAYGAINEDYIEVTLDNELDPYLDGSLHTIEFYNPGPSSLYGVMVDDVWFENCSYYEEFTPNDIWVNFTYQVDMDQGEVVVEYAHWNATDGECCPPGEAAWTQLGDSITGRTPGVCQNFSEKITILYTDLCLRIRLDTTVMPYPPIWGIGFHMHEIFISDIVYDAFDNMTYNFYEDFEDGSFDIPDQPGEAPNFEWCVDCVRYGDHWSRVGDFEFFCGGADVPQPMPFGCKNFTLVGTDDYGDGWYYPDVFIDVYVDGVKVVSNFQCPPYSSSYEEIDFGPVCGGSEIVVDCKMSGTDYWGNEVAWFLYDEDGTLWASDGEGGTTPYWGETTVDLPEMPLTILPTAFWPAEPIDTACVWETEIEDCYEAYLVGYWMYDIPAECTVTFEISVDGGDNWFIIAQVIGPADQGAYVPIPCTMYDLTPFVGNKILVRTHVDNYGANRGWILIKDYAIYGKQDMIPPNVAISLSGNNIGGNMYAGPVTVTVTGTDNKGVEEIHYTIDGGAETIVAGNQATFTVSGDGDHTVTAWAVDIVGNVGPTPPASASFSIDATPPTVQITAPENGLYLFGNKLLSMSKPFIIGAFTIEATADDAQGVAFVEFFLNGESLGADLTAPYSAYCALKNMGAAEISAVAEDGVGNSAEDSLDVTYYKFL